MTAVLTRRFLLFPLLVVWASPWSACGLCVGAIGLLTGGRCRIRRGVLEFHGGCVSWLLTRAPIAGGAAAITLGHTVLGRTGHDLDRCREHELVHVRQYERWGLFFVPAYLTSSIVLWLKGRNAYLENPFERQAFDIADGADRPGDASHG